MRTARLVFCAGLLLLTIGSPAAADWLVTVDGAEIETRGEWKVRGAVVVFELPNGTLSSMRLSEIDLDASRERNEAAERDEAPAEEQQPEKKKESVLRLTNDDIPPASGRAAVSGASGAEGGEQEDEEAASPREPNTVRVAAPAPGATATEPFHVLSWQKAPEADLGVRITGTLQNGGQQQQQQITATIVALNEDGDFVDEASAFVTSPVLRPAAATKFQATLREATADEVVEIRLTVSSRAPPASRDETREPLPPPSPDSR